MAQGGLSEADTVPVAGSSRFALWTSLQTLSAAQTGSRQAECPAGDRASLHSCFAKTRLLWPSEHGLYRAGQSDDPSWCGRSGSTHMGDSPPGSPPAGSPPLVASVLSLCTSSCLASRGFGSATGERRQAEGTTVPPANPSDGSRASHAQMDSRGGALLSASTCPYLRAGEAGIPPTIWR